MAREPILENLAVLSHRCSPGYLIHCETTGATAAVDTPEADAYRRELAKRGWTLTHILNTHHHWDHTGANMELKTEGVQILGPAGEKEKIPGIDVALQGGDEFFLGQAKAQVLEVGGHTKGHIAIYFPESHKVFVGDSLFALGCGRMFEGTPEQFWKSMTTLRALPDETMVYWYVPCGCDVLRALLCWYVGKIVLLTTNLCASFFHAHRLTFKKLFSAHEYTLSNAKFAMNVEPGNPDLQKRFEEVQAARDRGEPTVPSWMGDEKKTNPFLRCDISEEIRKNVGVAQGDSDAVVFGKVRKAKDKF